MNSINENIFELEKELLKSEVRKSAKRINELLSEDFMEICSNGTVYHYKNGDVFQELDNNEEINWKINDFKVNKISEECLLVTYQLTKQDEEKESIKYSLRSSIWRYSNGKWTMIFHQGTCIGK